MKTKIKGVTPTNTNRNIAKVNLKETEITESFGFVFTPKVIFRRLIFFQYENRKE